MFCYYSYQYFGSSLGFLRVYPGRPWQRNVIGFREDYDPRFRPWYSAAISGPKDVVIVVDTSRSLAEFVFRRYVWLCVAQMVQLYYYVSYYVICSMLALYINSSVTGYPCCTKHGLEDIVAIPKKFSWPLILVTHSIV